MTEGLGACLHPLLSLHAHARSGLKLQARAETRNGLAVRVRLPQGVEDVHGPLDVLLVKPRSTVVLWKERWPGGKTDKKEKKG